MVELALAEIGADYEFITVDLRQAEQRDDAFASVNPQRKLPALEMPDGTMITESAAILLMLDRLHPAAGLLPGDETADYATALRWLIFVAAECYPLVEISDYPERFAPDGAENAGIVREKARELWRQRWLIVEANIAGDHSLLARGCCATDFAIAVVSRWAQQDDWRAHNTPKIDAIADAVANRPATDEAWQRNFPPENA
ncbi:MAG: glutathione S-transferase [Rhodospirillaceae bacterium]|nr:glutathione S-transferase [Rhodospirillaceae bacterium]